MEPKSKVHHFVGYNTESTGYRLYDPIVSRDVVFDESSHSEGDPFAAIDSRLGDPETHGLHR